MRKITEKDYKKIQRLRDRFYNGIDEYCNRLDDTDRFMRPFEAIMQIINDARENK